MSTLADFYVVSEGGVCMFAKTQERSQTKDVDLVAGYLNALNALSRRVASDSINALNFKRSKMIIQNLYGMQFAARVSKQADSDVVRQKITLFAKKFFEKFPPDFIARKWGGDINAFKCMEEAFQRYLADCNSPMQPPMRLATW